MFTLSIGTQAINTTPFVPDLEVYRRPKDSDTKVATVGKILCTPTRVRFQREDRSRSFSPLRFLWWASLLMGARAQSNTPFPASIELSALTGMNGFVLNGEQSSDWSGFSVASAGDVNGDEVADLLIGAYGANSKAGKTYVVFGRVGVGSTGNLVLASLNGTNGFVLNGEKSIGSGYSVASAGDVNGDKIDDLLIGVWGGGNSYVVFGRVGLGSTGSIALSSLNGTSGFVLDGRGYSVASAGDVNGDKVGDLLIGAYGKSYVVFGRVGLGNTGSLPLSSLDGINGFVLNGEGTNDFSGYSVSSAGDVNGDAIADLLIGAYGVNSNAGKSYVIFGRAGLGNTGSLDLLSLNGTNGFVLNGEQTNDFSGYSVASAADVNGV